MGNIKDELKVQFQQICDQAVDAGITANDLSCFQIVQRINKIKKPTKKSKLLPAVKVVFISLLMVLTALATFEVAIVWSKPTGYPLVESYHEKLTTWMFENFWDVKTDKEPCIIEMSEFMQDLFRPPVDCSICRNVTQIDRMSNLTPEVFTRIYAYSSRPVVISDGMRGWTAREHFSFEFFKSVYSEDSPALENFENECQFFPYKTNFSCLGEVFNMSEERAKEPWYIGWSNCDSQAANILREHYKRPYFLPHDSESSKTDWIFMGTPDYGAHLHIDSVENPSWQAQVKGHKLWTLEPPPECYFECPRQLEITVHPGEIIVLDTNHWFHKTLIVEDELSITIGSEYD
ncbi:uncharacterized protein LOC117105141 [Anneissia japonica]|uniref:uncharacterized protein LOC117105141 n=1 Tax=Anneissia japonica TaxID=1529436 RepID=UPI00142582A1|nr:uncharacterized protein LOC117105141 [Anneissia japonica]XP_033102101.1 uncharacterized protein LOC117105141 [Anneissia japonica]